MNARDHAEMASHLMEGHLLPAFEGGGMGPPLESEVERAQAHALTAIAMTLTQREADSTTWDEIMGYGGTS